MNNHYTHIFSEDTNTPELRNPMKWNLFAFRRINRIFQSK